jgi:hypothetical protein
MLRRAEAERTGRHVGARALVRRTERPDRVEHDLAAPWILDRSHRRGRTALKGGVSRYDRLEGVTLIQPLNQRNISFQTRPWNDGNHDLRAQNDEIVFARCTGSLQPALGAGHRAWAGC